MAAVMATPGKFSGRVELPHHTLGGLPDVDSSLPYFCLVESDTGFRQPSTKWTCDLPMNRAVSRRHVSEANTNRFALLLQVHRTKPFDQLGENASIRHG